MRKRPLCLACLAVLMVQTIYFIAGGGSDCKNAPAGTVFYGAPAEKYISLQGTVYRKAQTSDYQILYLKNNSISYYNKSFEESRILVYDDGFHDIDIGNVICVSGSAKAFEMAHNPGNFDSRSYYAKQGLYGSVWSKEIKVISGEVSVIAEALFRIRQRWRDCILRHLGERQGGVMTAMLTGEKSDMEGSIKKLYQRNGISHILAISGLHISFLGLSLYELLRKAGGSYKVAGAVACIVVVCYVWMVGMPISALRALCMLLIRIGADFCGRAYDMATAFLVSAVLTTTIQPYCFADAGFWLSYGAIAGILIMTPVITFLLPKKVCRFSGFVTSLSVFLVLFPIQLYYYYEVSVYSLFLNVIVISLMTILLGMGMLGSIGCLIYDSLGGVLFLPCRLILMVLEKIALFFDRLPFSTHTLGQPSVKWIAAYYFCLLLMIFLVHAGKEECRRYRIYFFLLFAALWLTQKGAHDTREMCAVTFLDVGQGDGIVLRGPEGKTYLVDGGSSDVSQVGEYRIIPYLKSQGIEGIEYVFVTHGDKDHISGVEELLSSPDEGIRINALVFPAGYEKDKALLKLKILAESNGIYVGVIKPGVQITEGEMKIFCIWPEEDSGGSVQDGNEKSMVLDVTFGEFSLLLTGDVDGAGEDALKEKLKRQEGYDVLKVSHHGSKNASGEEFLDVVRPEIAIVSAGRENDYGHPHQETIDRLGKWTRDIYSTAVNGALTVKSDGKTVSVVGFH